ncbi:MAG: 3-deoxy-manno-octulosonate-8-phosphatase KdsC [Gammaproteobacteria bacterium]|nr:3-deoxy-manno-octulosonate-8-phosphatase KdsC [Gammaproteobacteria bacterium]
MQTTDELQQLASRIRLAVFDVDGVLTDGSLYLGENGNEYKAFNVKDGHGMVMLRESGCYLAVITSRSSTIVAERMRSLGIEHVYQGQNDKRVALLDLSNKLEIEPGDILYVGDDVIDLPAMRRVGFPVAVADAHPLVKENALAVTEAIGGRGAVREVCEFILAAQGKLQAKLDQYLE